MSAPPPGTRPTPTPAQRDRAPRPADTGPSAVPGLLADRRLRLGAAPIPVTLLALAVDQVHPLGDLVAGGSLLALTGLLAHTALRGRALADGLRRQVPAQALRDPLTGLGTRAALVRDLGEVAAESAPVRPHVLVLFGIDGFKHYNDAFGLTAGDALLERLAAYLVEAIAPFGGRAYRTSGAEFGVVAPGASREADALVVAAGTALTERTDAFTVTCSHGEALLPAEARDRSDALHLADQRLRARKARRGDSAARQTRDVLLEVLRTHQRERRTSGRNVAQLAVAVGRRLELTPEQLDETARAAELQDIGKLAIHEAILRKRSRLDDSEWRVVQRHPVAGERIVASAPALAPVAKLVRSSYERYDGGGYPDGLAGDDIPLGARIIAVCVAFDAMTTQRAYRRAISPRDAMAELRRCSGAQFDPRVVEAFGEEIVSSPPRAAGPPSAA
jgi:two-component system, cell cycle response regulator